MIEGNKDEAEKCIDIAQAAFSSGNAEKAERFLLKAERLYPTARAKELLARVKAAGPSTATPNKTPPSSPSGDDVRKRKPPAHQPQQREYTSEQLEAVRRIKTKCKDYYEILGKFVTLFYLIIMHKVTFYVVGRRPCGCLRKDRSMFNCEFSE